MNIDDQIPPLHEYLDRLRRRLMPAASVPPPKTGDGRVAAVLAPLIVRDGAIEVLYTRRSDRIVSHRGQVAFPGGGFDGRDKDLIATALRETHEEVGLDPAAIHVLGSFPGRRTFGTNIDVTPFVGVIYGTPALRADPREVADIFTVPLDALNDPRHRGQHRMNRDGAPVAYPAILYGGQVIWGLTYHLTLTLLDLLSHVRAENPGAN
jgi:8-oxo-dGTP pyrophosphatase MutT (NUDIX family)